MLVDFEKVNIYVKPGITDMRKQINGLTSLVVNELELDPLSGSMFLFSNRNRKLLKILYWDKNGFCMWVKRLEKDRFPWPNDKIEAMEINSNQLKMLLEGIDFWRAHKRLENVEIF